MFKKYCEKLRADGQVEQVDAIINLELITVNLESRRSIQSRCLLFGVGMRRSEENK